MAGQSARIVWQDTYELGKGVLFDGSLAPPVFKALELPAEPKQHYGSPALTVKTVTDAASYSDLTTASVTASASYNGAISASVSAEASYLKETAGSSTHVHLVASSSWLGKPRQFHEGYEPRLSEKAIAVLKGPNGAAKFAAKYGHSYIFGSISGGWYHAVYSFSAKDSSQKSTIKTKVEASFKSAMASAAATAEFQNTAKEVQQSSSLEVSAQASAWDQSQPYNLDDIAMVVKNASTLVQDTEGFPLLAIMRPYSALSDYANNVNDDAKKEVQLGSESIKAIQAQYARLDYLQQGVQDYKALTSSAKLQTRLDALSDSVAATLSNLQDVTWADPATAGSLNKWIKSKHVTDNDTWGPLLADQGGQRELDAIAAVITRAVAVGSSDVRGGGGGDGFNDVGELSVNGVPPKIVKLVISSGSRVDRLTVTYRTANGGTAERTHGGGGGGEQKVSFDLADDEYINRMEVRSGSVVDALKFTTNKGRYYGWNGGDGGDYFNFTAPGQACGFGGAAGSILDRICMYYIVDQPDI